MDLLVRTTWVFTTKRFKNLLLIPRNTVKSVRSSMRRKIGRVLTTVVRVCAYLWN
uniref:Uncharacterized protein n=1 Tax=Anopheles minimus TaxID=112268 RepID=A0A182W917_9DIPT